MNKYLEKIAETVYRQNVPLQRHAYREHVPEKLETIENPVASTKYDGANFYIRFNEIGQPKFISRRLSVKGTEIDRTAQLPHLASIALLNHAGDILNAELIHNGFKKDAPESHGNVSGILNSLPERAIRTQKETGPVRAVLFDVINPPLPTYKQKIEYLKKIEKEAGKPSVFFVPKFATGIKAIENLLEENKKKKHEGVIITSLTAPEDGNPRYKAKNVETYNLRVTGITRLINIKGEPQNKMGALVVEDCNGNEVANVGTGFTDALRKEIWENQKGWIGRIINVKTFGLAARRLRGPVFNGDADVNEPDCVI